MRHITLLTSAPIIIESINSEKNNSGNNNHSSTIVCLYTAYRVDKTYFTPIF